MPRKGANMTKAEMWSLLTTINDELVMLSSAVGEMQKCLEGAKKHQEDVELWQEGHTAVLSSKVPKELAIRLDRLLETKPLQGSTRSSIIANLVTDYCNTWEDVWRYEAEKKSV
jgi:hypothetical protein